MLDADLKSQLREAQTQTDIFKILKQVNSTDLSSSDYFFISRTLNKTNVESSLKIAYFSNYTIAPLPSFIEVQSAFHTIGVRSYVGEYNQHYQEILNPTSSALSFKPDIAFLLLSLHELCPTLLNSFTSLTDQHKLDQKNVILEHIVDWVNLTVEKTNATVFVSNFLQPTFPSLGIADSQQGYSENEFYIELNLALQKKFRENPRVYIFDIDKLAARYGKEGAINPKMFFMAKVIWHEKFLPTIAQEFIRYITSFLGQTKKCLVLDLDNTLWGGVIGEDGIDGLKVGTGDPVSEAYLAFQYKIAALKNRGVILGICSKNNQADALEVFDKKVDMPLKLTDFSASEINWEPKYINIKNIAKKLNIGTESILFIDDNPVECSLVSQALPEVTTVQLPADPALYATILDNILVFEKFNVLSDDRNKAQQYSQNEQRQEEKERIGDLNTYLHSLETKIKIRLATDQDLPRVHQLFSKTNQFNLTTIRYSMSDIEDFHKNEQDSIIVISVQDKFGDLGTVGLCLLKNQEHQLVIDSFILSCRAMGRGVETALLNYVKREYLSGHPSLKLIGSYIPTNKNMPTKDFFEAQGLTLITENSSGERYYEMLSDDALEIPCPWINVID
ncbi:HAD-IIIC family phosphatase [Acaryochloris marina]|uniref:FkbH domain protein n=1 Tax=Acaryochloris marina (strain MBIC 11017) TaxID=329726 RepID=B0C823_ACAM1|nr:HAD-IIIC family phosphatase [Acaryochloris marina]ABW27707.1 FkbH domain protein [Acaryochloris marina MBIC11017]BDM82441.1 hypothetical protein AM10699_53020 [Acaryochloris marina MBIC10699]